MSNTRLIDVDLLDEPGNRYEIQTLLGEGTYGEVHRALDTKTQKLVAIKIFDHLEETIEELEQDFYVISTHWIHPNIPHFSGLFVKKGVSRKEDQVWLVMELCDGGSVSELVKVQCFKTSRANFPSKFQNMFCLNFDNVPNLKSLFLIPLGM